MGDGFIDVSAIHERTKVDGLRTIIMILALSRLK